MAPLKDDQLPFEVAEVLYRINVRGPVPLDLLQSAFAAILNETVPPSRDVLLGALLVGLMARGPSPTEVAALLRVAFALDGHVPEEVSRLQLPSGARLVGAVGSGKKGVKTINISTPSAIVAVSAGAFVAKPGSSSTSSLVGSADFMAAVGMNPRADLETTNRVLQRTGFGFYVVEKLIPRFDAAYGGKFFAPSVLSFGLAALLCPVKVDTLLFGLAHPDVECALKVLRECRVDDAFVVSTTHDDVHFVDEMGIYGLTKVIGMRGGMIGAVRQIDPTALLGIPRYLPADIAQAPSARENIARAVRVLAGRGDPAHEDIISINAGNLLYLAGLAEDLAEGYSIAKGAIRARRPMEKLLEVVEATDGDVSALRSYL